MSSILKRIQSGITALTFREATPQPRIISYGQFGNGLTVEEVQSVVEWLFLSLVNAGYEGRSHLFFLHPDNESELKPQLQKLLDRGEPMFGYRCGGRVPPSPTGYYWRLMPEHNSLRIYQLEVRQAD